MLIWANENWTKKWDGKDNDFALTDIHMNNDIITFHLTDYTETAIPAIKRNDRKTATGYSYNLHGQRVSDNYKGLVVIDGKKVMRK